MLLLHLTQTSPSVRCPCSPRRAVVGRELCAGGPGPAKAADDCGRQPAQKENTHDSAGKTEKGSPVFSLQIFERTQRRTSRPSATRASRVLCTTVSRRGSHSVMLLSCHKAGWPQVSCWTDAKTFRPFSAGWPTWRSTRWRETSTREFVRRRPRRLTPPSHDSGPRSCRWTILHKTLTRLRDFDGAVASLSDALEGHSISPDTAGATLTSSLRCV